MVQATGTDFFFLFRAEFSMLGTAGLVASQLTGSTTMVNYSWSMRPEADPPNSS